MTPELSPRGANVVAFGGNALQKVGERGSVEEMRANLASTLPGLRPLLEGGAALCLTHGNGPQVGNALIRSEAGEPQVPAHPLDIAVATTQAEIGSLIATELRPLLAEWGVDRAVTVVVTHVVVDPADPALQSPTKPIGPFYQAEDVEFLEEGRGWTMVEDAGRGYRRVVGSPQPLDVLELPQVARLMAQGTIVVCAGGGGIPVAIAPDGRVFGVEAVIDKDRTAALLAERLGAERLIILTAVDSVFEGFGTDQERALHELTADEATALLESGVLPAGSMAPKVEAGLRFAAVTGNEALITSESSLAEALAGGAAGTWIRRA